MYLDMGAHHETASRRSSGMSRVLTISIHESGLCLFPGTGHAGDSGEPGTLGTTVNIVLDRRTGDLEWLRAVHGIVPPLLRAFSLEMIVSQHGTDAHRAASLTDLELSVDIMVLVYDGGGLGATPRAAPVGGAGQRRGPR